MSATATRAKVTFTDRDITGFLDMLRYDRAVVEDWQPEEHEYRRNVRRWTVTLSAARFTPDRWSSFGLTLRIS